MTNSRAKIEEIFATTNPGVEDVGVRKRKWVDGEGMDYTKEVNAAIDSIEALLVEAQQQLAEKIKLNAVLSSNMVGRHSEDFGKLVDVTLAELTSGADTK